MTLTIDGVPSGESYAAGGTSIFGNYFVIGFTEAGSTDTALELGFTNAVATGTYPLSESEFALGASDARATVALRYEGEPGRLYVAGAITLDTFDRDDPSDPFAFIEGSFEGTLATSSGNVAVEGEFLRESTCRANPGAIALGC